MNLTQLHNLFSRECRRRTQEKKREGWTGWNDEQCYNDMVGRLLTNAAQGVFKNDPQSLVDTANLAMFIWYQMTTQNTGKGEP